MTDPQRPAPYPVQPAVTSGVNRAGRIALIAGIVGIVIAPLVSLTL